MQGLIPSKEERGAATAGQLERFFIFALMWGIGALLELDDRAKMEDFIMAHESKLDLPPVEEGQTMFEYVVNDCGK